MLTLLSGKVAVWVISLYGVKPVSVLTKLVTPGEPLVGETISFGFTVITVTVIGVEVEEEKLVLPLYRAVIECDPRLSALVLYGAAPTLLRAIAGLRALLPS